MSLLGTSGSVVIVGAGHAGVTVATSLRERGWIGPIHLVGSEAGAPYQRPALSKEYLSGGSTDADLLLRTPEGLRAIGIDYCQGRTALHIDRATRSVSLDSGDTLTYDALILATGSHPRALPVPGSGMDGIVSLRTRDDSRRLRERLAVAGHVVISGGGFLGLEVAATAARAGRAVTVLERLESLLQRAVGPTTAGHLADLHRANGVVIRAGVGVEGFGGIDRVHEVHASDGSTVRADLVLVAVGATPSTEIAERAGLAVDGGVLVDDRLRSSDPAIFAIGDCARYPDPHSSALIRLESVQNAVDQARHVAGQLCAGDGGPYANVPWFWSHQYDRNLQIAGISAPSDDEVRLIAGRDDALAVARARNGRLVAVETVNDPKTHVRARRLLADGPVDLDRAVELGAPSHAPAM